MEGDGQMDANNEVYWVFRLFVAGKTLKNDHSIAMLEQICEMHLEGKCHIEVIDVIQNPLSCIEENILATPTLIKKLPEPVRRIIGDLSVKENVLLGLEINVKN